ETAWSPYRRWGSQPNQGPPDRWVVLSERALVGAHCRLLSRLLSSLLDLKWAPEPGSKGRLREGPSGMGAPGSLGPPGSVRERGEGRDHSSDELNSKFRSQCLHSSSSSPETETTPTGVSPTSPLLARSPSTNQPFPPPGHAPLQHPLSPSGALTLPKLRTPLAPRDSVQLGKKHCSQPPPVLDRLHPLNASPAPTSPGPVAPEPASPGGGALAGPVEDPERRDAEVLKPPTPPLHRLPSWVRWSHLLRLCASSKVRCTNVFSYCPASGPFPHLIYKNINVPVFTTLKGKATQISSVPLADEDSGSEDDSGSLASLRTSAPGPDRKGSGPGSPRAAKRGVSMSSVGSESDYAIPPDAHSLDSDYSEPELKVQRTSSYSCGSSSGPVLEKSGYLLKMGSQIKAWKRRWFILRNGEILYYKSPSDVIRKPQGQMELTSSCRIARGEGAQTFQLVTEKKTFFLTADSPNILEEWIRVLQNVLKVQASGPVAVETASKPAARGWLTKVKHGHSKLVWCSLVGKVFYYYRNQDDKLPLGQLRVRDAVVQEVDRSCDSDEDYEAGARGPGPRGAGGRGFLSSHCTLVVQPWEQSPTYLLIGTKQEKDTWLYHLTVAAGSGAGLKVGTEYEQVIGKLLDAEGDPDSVLWGSVALCCSQEGLRCSLTTLPSDALQTEALKLFKSCQLFINVLVESPSIDYHTSLAQNALQVCLTHPELQNEMYCQLIKQTHRRTPNNYSLTQCWQLLSLCVALFLPQQHFLWYLRQYLQRIADPNEVGKYAVYCQRSLERTLSSGEREAKPSRMEIVSILLRNPYHHSLPFSLPVHFSNQAYQVVGFDGSTTVEEFLGPLNQRVGLRKTQLSGFALFTDDPSGKDLEHCLQPSAKICDVISKWEQALKELHPGKYEGTRIVRLTYKSRLCFRAHAKGETERERLLLAYQVNDEVQGGHFPVSKELALEVAALMAQVEHGDLERPTPPSSSSPPSPPSPVTPGSPSSKAQLVLLQIMERFYPKRYKQDCTSDQLRELTERLAAKWSMLRGRSASECVRIYLTVARKWTLFGAKLFSAKVRVEMLLTFINVRRCLSFHTLATYPYQSVITFGGYRDDFMAVVSQQREPGAPKKSVEKLVFSLAKPKILELTLLMASYINHWSPGGPPPAPTGPQWDGDSRHFPCMTYTTKSPTLL
uniref:Pleckstrin homology domain containing, family H (with MyTH4 domain) member 1 n=1 Tax=Gadus morhua TaxID=8049 RepID=A0A8C5AN99_GADMO